MSRADASPPGFWSFAARAAEPFAGYGGTQAGFDGRMTDKRAPVAFAGAAAHCRQQ